MIGNIKIKKEILFPAWKIRYEPNASKWVVHKF